MSAVTWEILVRNYYYIVGSSGSFEFGIKVLKDYLVTWPLPNFIEEEVFNLTKMPWDLYQELYKGVAPTKTYRIEDNLRLIEVNINDVIPCWITIDAPEIPLTPVYTVLARRWGSPEGHTYLVGTASTYEGALELGKTEEYLRGGKYKSEILRGYLESVATETLKGE
jgi:hypothetical protein